MLIDWFTVGAQALNFLVLVWLLRRFLYKPVLHAIDEREKRIAAELADADAKRAEAQEERTAFQRKNEELDRQRAALLSAATDEAKAEGQRLIEKARAAAEALRAKRDEELQSEARDLGQALRQRTQQEVFAIARKALSDLTTASLEERLAEVFTRRLRDMDLAAKGRLSEAIRTAPDPIVVRSAFDLPAEQQAAIKSALHEAFSAPIDLRFETAPALVSGIELTANGLRLAWTIADYLEALEKAVREVVSAPARPPPSPDLRTAVPPAPSAP